MNEQVRQLETILRASIERHQAAGKKLVRRLFSDENGTKCCALGTLSFESGADGCFNPARAKDYLKQGERP